MTDGIQKISRLNVRMAINGYSIRVDEIDLYPSGQEVVTGIITESTCITDRGHAMFDDINKIFRLYVQSDMPGVGTFEYVHCMYIYQPGFEMRDKPDPIR